MSSPCDFATCFYFLEQARTLREVLDWFMAPCSKEEVTLGDTTITIFRFNPVLKDSRVRQLQYEVSVNPTNEVATKTTIIQLLGLHLRLNSYSIWDLDAMLRAIFKCVNNEGQSEIILFQQFLNRFVSLMQDMIHNKDPKHTRASVEDQLDEWDSWKFISEEDNQLLNLFFPPKKDKKEAEDVPKEPARKKAKKTHDDSE